MVHGVVEMGRGQSFFSDNLLAGLAPLLVAGAKKAIDLRDRGLAARHYGSSWERVAGHGADLVDRLSAMSVEAFAQFVGSADQASWRRRAVAVRRIENSDEALGLTVLDPLDAGADIGAIRSIQRAVDRSARNSGLAIGFRQKDDMPMRTLVQAREVFLPDTVIFQQEAGDDAIGGFDLAVAGLHLASP